jgi:hypothetical protein
MQALAVRTAAGRARALASAAKAEASATGPTSPTSADAKHATTASGPAGSRERRRRRSVENVRGVLSPSLRFPSSFLFLIVSRSVAPVFVLIPFHRDRRLTPAPAFLSSKIARSSLFGCIPPSIHSSAVQSFVRAAA